ncbi:Rab28, partial [Symbiodinium sp. KB8]
LVVEAFEVPGAAAASNAAALATASGESKVGEEATEAAASTLEDGITQHSVGGRIVAARLPHVVLVANKMDLAHTRAVKVGKHKAFVQENSLAADYFVSAKSGDYVPQTFTRIAAALAGVKLDRADVLQATKVVTAQIVNHQANDPAVDEKGSSGGDKSKCCIM